MSKKIDDDDGDAAVSQFGNAGNCGSGGRGYSLNWVGVCCMCTSFQN